jgi:hypothetical protein
MLLPDTLRRRVDAVRSFEGFDLLGEFGNARPLLLSWLMGQGTTNLASARR